jgi:hypothetical protein
VSVWVAASASVGASVRAASAASAASAKVSVHGDDATLRRGPRLDELSTVARGSSGLKSPLQRFPTMEVASVTELSCVEPYGSHRVESPMIDPRSVASQLSRRRARFEEPPCARRGRIASVARCVPAHGLPTRSVASAWQSSPRVALAPSMQALRRSALAQKCARIAGRIARLAAKGAEPAWQ